MLQKAIFSIIMSLLFVFSAFVTNAQDDCYEIFRAEGISEFNKSNYSQAIQNYIVANGCEDKPAENDILILKKTAENCISYINEADSMFNINEFEIALYMYEQVIALNTNDLYCRTQSDKCIQNMQCFISKRNEGLKYFFASNYSEAFQKFQETKNCNKIPDYNDLEALSKNSTICITSKHLADSLFYQRQFEKAEEYYNAVLALNPFDTVCIEQKNNIPGKGMQALTLLPSSGYYFTIGKSKRFLNPTFITTELTFVNLFEPVSNSFLDISFGKTGKWGYFANFSVGTITLAGYENTGVFTSLNYVDANNNDVFLTFEGEPYSWEYSLQNLYGNDFIEKKFCFALSAGISKQIFQKRLFSLHLYSGLGYANWGEAMKDLKTDYKPINYNVPVYRFREINGTNILTEVDKYYILVPESSVSKFFDGLELNFGLLFSTYRYLLKAGIATIPLIDNEFSGSYNLRYSIGLGYSF